MGNQTSNQNSTIPQHGSGESNEEVGGCPVMGNKKNSAQQAKEIPEGCPVASQNGGYKHPHVYNVYGQRIDPNNNMPAQPAQNMHPEQMKTLPTDRLQSTIRKGGTESTWTYPSEQMFYNALKRKGKANGITEDDMGMLLAIHNGTNERAWKMVMEWEKDFKECADPTLLKFQGKPHDLSPKARFKTLFMGYPMPFDRHDWTVDRCGKEVRYVLDFYYDESDEDKNMDIAKNNDGFLVPKRVLIDVRPALDSVDNAIHRAKHLFSDDSSL